MESQNESKVRLGALRWVGSEEDFGYTAHRGVARSRELPEGTPNIEGDSRMSKNKGVSMNVKPLADRILVRRLEQKEEVRGGIIIPDTAKEKPTEGEVVAVGPGRVSKDGKRIALEIERGDRVLLGKYSGTEVKIDGEDFVILREDDVLATFSKK
jgi:chaperonin GroES